jgi:ribosomal protein L27
MGNDHTIFALVAGRVELERSKKNRKRNIVHVIPEGEGEVASIPSSM